MIRNRFIQIIILFISSLVIGSCSKDFKQLITTQINRSKIFPTDSNVVLVNFASLDDSLRAEEIDIINSYKPRTVAIDSYISKEKLAKSGNKLANALNNIDKLVLISELVLNHKTNQYDSIALPAIDIIKNAKTGFTDVGCGVYYFKKNKKIKVNTHFEPITYINTCLNYHFSVEIVKLYDPLKAEKILKRNNKIEFINFEGGFNRFKVFDPVDVFNRVPELDRIKDKIVIFGYLGEHKGDKYSLGDKHFTPLTHLIPDSSKPDLFGVEILARIVGMILAESYID